MIDKAMQGSDDGAEPVSASAKKPYDPPVLTKLGALRDAVVGAATSAAGWFKEKLGIHSPSRVFMQLGSYVGEGAALGIQNGAGMVRQAALDQLLEQLSGHLHWRRRLDPDPRLPLTAQRARDFLHANLERDIGLEDLAQACGIDRFRLTRAFKAAFGIAPHAYLIQLRLARARRLLAQGQTPAEVAVALGFADQSHLGRWFRRAYQLTPADYRRRCSNLPD